MDQLIPQSFFQDLYDGREIVNFTVGAGSKPGDNYASVVLSVDFGFKDNPQEEKHLIIKIFPKSDDQQKFLIKSQIFKKEIQIYTLWFEELRRLIQGTGIDHLPYPEFIKGEALEFFYENRKIEVMDNYLLMENVVKNLNYKLAGSKLLDFDHCKIFFEELSKVHALSWAYKEKNNLPSLKSKFPFFKETLNTTESKPMFQQFLDKNLARFLKTLEVKFGPNSQIYKSYEEWGKRDLLEEQFEFCKDPVDLEKLETFLKVRSFTKEEIANSESWLSANESDLWATNLLFHYDPETGKPDKVIILDFQFASEQCPTIDLTFFIYLSTNLETRKSIRKLLKMYHENYLKTLGEFPEVRTPKDFENFDHFMRRFRTSQYFGLICGVMWFPLILESHNSETETEDLFSSSEKKVREVAPATGEVAQWLCELAQEFYDAQII